VQTRVIRNLKSRLFENVLNQDVGFFDVTLTGTITTRLTTDVEAMANTITWSFRWLTEACARTLAIFAYML